MLIEVKQPFDMREMKIDRGRMGIKRSKKNPLIKNRLNFNIPDFKRLETRNSQQSSIVNSNLSLALFLQRNVFHSFKSPKDLRLFG